MSIVDPSENDNSQSPIITSHLNSNAMKKQSGKLTSFLIFLQKLEVEKFITHRVPFSDINKAFEYMLKGEGLRCIISMEE